LFLLRKSAPSGHFPFIVEVVIGCNLRDAAFAKRSDERSRRRFSFDGRGGRALRFPVQELRGVAQIGGFESLVKTGEDRAQVSATFRALPHTFLHARQAQRCAQFECDRALAPRNGADLPQRTADEFRRCELLGKKLGPESQQFRIEKTLTGFVRNRHRVVERDQSQFDFTDRTCVRAISVIA
jgi:hypothetical protein